MEHALSFLLAISTLILIILVIAIYNYKPSENKSETPIEQFATDEKYKQITKYCCQNSNRVYNSVSIDMDYSM
ncbi:Hypothetical protein PACV_240 [Pacmanvirus A23]|uniref:Hypothetical protein n=1 Tax=Pacmanvirus A23 TaxID=1932881 RepID=UPI000A093686|nr:Hypothetical protein B9W72_gp238 [Pacmanvirus A23]SIP85955.1 Hypothetical protein PACV_240 [Pacmanvirus A23]